MAGRPSSGFVPHIAPITGAGPVGSAETADSGDLLNHYFFEALIRRLEELEGAERARRKSETSGVVQNFDSWLKVPAVEQDDERPAEPNKFSRARAIASYRKIANME